MRSEEAVRIRQLKQEEVFILLLLSYQMKTDSKNKFF